MNVQQGDKVSDTLTGFEGIVVGRVQYLTGCNQALVKPVGFKEDGTMLEAEWIDEQRLSVIEPSAYAVDNGETPGGPQNW